MQLAALLLQLVGMHPLAVNERKVQSAASVFIIGIERDAPFRPVAVERYPEVRQAQGLRETFTLPRLSARTKARDFLTRYPKAAYMSSVESWRELPGGDIEFTMRRLRSAD